MAYQQKDMTGSLFRNDRKESDTHPDYKGTALINGVEHWLDAWINESSSGQKYMSLKLKPKEAGLRNQTHAATQRGDTNLASRMNAAASRFESDDDLSDVPF